MNLRTLTRKYLGWCPGQGSASNFKGSVLSDFMRNLEAYSDFRLALVSITSILIIGSLVPPPQPYIGSGINPVITFGVNSDVGVEREERFLSTRYSGDLGEMSQYGIYYKIFVYEKLDSLKIMDQTASGLTLGELVTREREKVRFTYNSTDGRILIEVSDVDPGETGMSILSAFMTFKHDPLFKLQEVPSVQSIPSGISMGQETDLEISIDPFAIRDSDRLLRTEIMTFITSMAEEYVVLSSSPEGMVNEDDWFTRWIYDGSKTVFDTHSVNGLVRFGMDRGIGFGSAIRLIYGKPIYMVEAPVIDGDEFTFFDHGSSYWYQYSESFSPRYPSYEKIIEPPEDNVRTGIYFDDIQLSVDDEPILMENFDSGIFPGEKWSLDNYAKVQEHYFSSPPSALILREYEGISSSIGQFLDADEEWDSLNYSVSIMLPDYDTTYLNPKRGSSVNLRLTSGPSKSGVTGGISGGFTLRYDNGSYRTEIELSVRYYPGGNSNFGGWSRRSLSMSPSEWHRFSMVVDRASSEVMLYFDGSLTCRLPFTASFFESIEKASIWGTIP